VSVPRLAAALPLALLAGVAVAQTPAPDARGFALQTYEPPPAGDGFFTVPGADVPGHLVPGAALVFSWAREPLVIQSGGQTVPGGRLVHRQFWAFLQGSMGLSDRLLLDVAAPVALYQSGSPYLASLPEVSAAALGDLRLGARTPLWRAGPLDLAAALALWLPTGSTGAFASDGGVRLQPQLVAAGRHGAVEYGGAVGLLYRESSDRVVARVGTAVTFSAAGAWRRGPWRVGPELYGRYQLEGTATSPVEALLGGHWARGAIDAGVAIGTGLDRAPGAAPLRVVAQVAWRPPVPPAGPSPDELARQAADRAAAERLAAEQAEAARLAAEQEAARQAEAARLASQEAAASADAAEAARLAAEQEAARQAEAARLAAEQARRTADGDGDGTPDVKDACPDRPGVADADPARNGCPAPPLVKLTRERIEILQSVQFEKASDVIRPESRPLLTEVAKLLVAHPELTRVAVEGHSDAKGARDFNVSLSRLRALAVQRWLVEQGAVDEARLSAEGHGPDRPIASNDGEEGRARNRRVEFRIVEQR
jgi:OmpA-OmpF porin, OOP family